MILVHAVVVKNIKNVAASTISLIINVNLALTIGKKMNKNTTGT